MTRIHVSPDSKANDLISVLHQGKITEKNYDWVSSIYQVDTRTLGYEETHKHELKLRKRLHVSMFVSGRYLLHRKVSSYLHEWQSYCSNCNPVVSGTSQGSAGWPVCLRGYGFPGWLQYWITCCFSRHLLTPTPAEWLPLVFPWTACWEGEAILACWKEPSQEDSVDGRSLLFTKRRWWCSKVIRFRNRVKALMNWNPHPHGSPVTSDRWRGHCLCWEPAPCALSGMPLALPAFTSQLQLLSWGYLYYVFWLRVFL